LADVRDDVVVVVTPTGLPLLCEEQRLKELHKNPSAADTSPGSGAGAPVSSGPAIDLFSTPSSTNR